MTTSTAIYTAETHTIGGRLNGTARSSDGRLDIRLAPPGSTGSGTNPEQLFAAGWSACFLGALGLAAKRSNLRLPDDSAIDAQIELCLANGDYFLRGRMTVNLPGIAREQAQALADAAHQTCPYSKAVRGNIEVAIEVA
jgi:lipoyl-dependent peroxiredoxin